MSLLLFAWLLGAPHAAAPPSAGSALPVLTGDEVAALAAGDVVIRDKAPSQPGAVRVEAVADLRAPRDAVWAALLDFEGRKRGNRSLKAVEAYQPATATERWIRWTVSAFGAEVTYHNHYVLAPDRTSLLHELDATRDNDLAGSRGVYTLVPTAGGTRLVYDVETHFGRAVPGVVQRWLSSAAVEDFMVDMVRRAEDAR